MGEERQFHASATCNSNKGIELTWLTIIGDLLGLWANESDERGGANSGNRDGCGKVEVAIGLG